MTTDSPKLTILNVGHGNCALVRDGPGVVVIDVPGQSSLLRQALEVEGIAAIDAILLSHADEEHIGGVTALLSDEGLCVRRLYLNADLLRDTVAWYALRLAIRDTRRRCPEFEVGNLTSMRTDELDRLLPELCIEVLAPGHELVVTGPGGITPAGIRLSSNSMAAVVRISSQDTRGILLAGDMDRVGLDALLAGGVELGADVLVFPHHGGFPGRADPERYAADLTAAVEPDVVVFSHGRRHPGRVPTPRREILAGVRQSVPSVRIACTQLSKGCAQTPPEASQGYLASLPGAGACCAGALEFRFSAAGVESMQLDGHAQWVQRNVPGRMCRERTEAPPHAPSWRDPP